MIQCYSYIVFTVYGFVSGHMQWKSIVAPHSIKHKINNIPPLKMREQWIVK